MSRLNVPATLCSMNSDRHQAYQNTRFIAQYSDLKAYCETLIENPDFHWIAIDTEFVRVDTYFPELSLVQISDSNHQLTIIDPLAITENSEDSNQGLAPLIELLANPNICKVFHSARQDLEVLFHLDQRLPQNIFDTQLASVFFKYGDLAGFARVIEAELGVKLDKSQTRTNWHARPLNEEQIHYALDDVYYLAKLYAKFIEKLTSEQIQAISEDCKALLDESLYITPPEKAWQKIKGTKNFKPKQLAILQVLAQWREGFAIETNKPKKWAASDEVLLQIAKRPPKTVQALYKVPNIKASSVKAYGEIWITLIDEVFAQEPASYPQPELKPATATPTEDIQLQILLAICQQVALKYRIPISNITNKMEILDFIRETAKKEAPQKIGWRNLLFFKQAGQFIHGKSKLSWQQDHLKINTQ